MKIRLKILSGFLVLVAMLTVAGGFGIWEFNKLSNSVNSILDDNYKSILACNNMTDGLEEVESGIMLVMMGQMEMGKSAIDSGDSLFRASLEIAKANITEKNEDVFVEDLTRKYELFKQFWSANILNNSESPGLDWYLTHGHNSFLDAKMSVKELMMLNQTSMYNNAYNVREVAQRAVMPGFVAVVVALIFAIMFNFFINYYLVSPILRLIKAINNYHPAGKEINANIETRDEIKMLEDAVRTLVNKMNRKTT